MSLLPFILNFDDDVRRPEQLLDQHFGLVLRPHELDMISALPQRSLGRYYRPWHARSALAQRDAGSTVKADKDKFQVSLDVQQFSPNEISVKTVDNYVTVEGKHEEKQDEHGYISRQFVRRYALPEGHDPKDVVSSLSSDGVLTITAPRKAPALAESERVVPISITGPANCILENKNTKDAADSKKTTSDCNLN